jgi:magnesium transporter
MLLGAILGAISFPFVLGVFGDLRLAAAVATALFAAGSIAAIVGIAFPWVLARMRRDPAYGSGPIATIIQDVLSLLVYLAVVRAFGM